MKKYLADVRINKPYKVFKEGDNYLVERHVRQDSIHTGKIPVEHAHALAKALQGKTSTIEDAQLALRRLKLKSPLPYTWGYQEYYYAEKVLIALAALGCVEITRKSRRHYFEVHSLPSAEGK